MLTDSRLILTRLLSEGWIVDRVRGSHRMLRHADKSNVVVVPDPKKDLPVGTVKDTLLKSWLGPRLIRQQPAIPEGVQQPRLPRRHRRTSLPNPDQT